MEKDFDRWNKIKKNISEQGILSELQSFPRKGEVWICILGKNLGHEQNGGFDFTRPVLVVKKFNNHMFLVVPLSTKQKDIDYYYNFTDPNGVEAAAILAQLRLVSIERFKRPLYEMVERHLRSMCSILAGYFTQNRNPVI